MARRLGDDLCFHLGPFSVFSTTWQPRRKGEKIYRNGKESLLQHTVTLSTNSAAASDLLGQVLAGTPERRLSWKLLFTS